MKTKLLTFLSCCAFFLAGFNCYAKSYISGTYIPQSPEEQRALITDLETKIKNGDKSQETARKRALVHFRNLVHNFTKDRTDKVAKILKKTQKKYKKDYEIMAAYGSVLSMTLAFVDKSDMSTIMRVAKKAERFQDRAAKKAPNHIGVLMIRAMASYYAPRIAGRTYLAIKDLKEIIKLVGNDYGPEFVSFLEFHLGDSYYKLAQRKDAKKHWERTVALKGKGGNPKWIEKAEEKLKKLKI